ncbi:hypothetical protein GCM10010393_34120 [Streptomyces gobitricini]|uniref:Uncharacterized protein n=1 Tax=Streptomyces gobitricini TaxID=68211 RepID=A0ABP5ZIZ7_9ACTN
MRAGTRAPVAAEPALWPARRSGAESRRSRAVAGGRGRSRAVAGGGWSDGVPPAGWPPRRQCVRVLTEQWGLPAAPNGVRFLIRSRSAGSRTARAGQLFRDLWELPWTVGGL